MASERIDPLFFGPQERPLFGCHHGPATGAPSVLGVALAPPLGHEYSRAHRALRRLAQSLAESGVRALRFDFRGTGDSAGDAWPESLADWIADLEFAERELALRARVPRRALLGVRLAGTLALEAAARSQAPAGAAALVLWDPVLDGAEFVAGLRGAAARFEASLLSPDNAHDRARGGDLPALECLGCAWPRALLAEIESWSVPAFERAPAQRVLILESVLTPRARALAAEFERLGASVQHAASSGSQPWNEDVDRGLVPAADLARIVAYLRGEP